jgi:hypothetical protein
MRTPTLPFAFALVLLAPLAGCGQEEAVVDYQIHGATPAVPVLAVQTFELDEQGASAGSSFVWDDQPLEMPQRGSMSFFDQTPAPFRLCAVALGESDDLVLSAVSGWVQPVLDNTVEVELILAEAPGGEVPDPCGPEVEAWPEQ